MAAYYPLFEEEIKQGPPGIPGIGFKLTNNGNYDMEKGILTNLNHPIELNDSVTKYYADVIRRDLKSEIVALSKASLMQNLDGEFDARNIPMKNLGKPNDDKDAVTKNYVDRKTKNNDKRDDNILKRDSDGLYVLSLIRNVHYNFDNKRLMNVSDPIRNSDAVTKEYVDGNIFYATTEQYETFREGMFQAITFNKFSSKLLTPDMNLTCEMNMKIIIYLGSSHRKIPTIKLSIGSHHILERPLETNNESCVAIVFGRKDKQLLLEISSDGKENKIKPHIVIEKINYL
ncbi:hypothetical protein AVEN_10566-1 [Araneus ventricosus]|uniref:Uncharacterized protein n=1 Tax=Araneus ventricosus TaxID=182803 RepID=A0A4Y2NC66_ARAVE|nr:hypothetical protein AVEN_10566-1 [Araneus ventricosus]